MIVVTMEAVHVSCAPVHLALPSAHGHGTRPLAGRLQSYGAQGFGCVSCSESGLGRLTSGQFAAGDQEAVAFDIEEPEAD
jgi:hypothetical protein